MDDDYTTTVDCRGEWIHPGTTKSYLFRCSFCGGEVYYPQKCHMKRGEKTEPMIPYQYCPYCAHRMTTK